MSVSQGSTGNRRRIVLHFDLNNTIIMKDPAKGLSVQMNTARIVCKSAWGRIATRPGNDDQEEKYWQLAHD